MALSRSNLRRRASLNTILIVLSIITAFLAGLPVVAGILSETFGSAQRSTAFAAAPPGHYAVYTSSDETHDEIRVAPGDDPGDVITVATIERLPGFASRGAVSPDGTQLALVVVEAGTPAQPEASLQLLDLESGERTVIATRVEFRQVPVWDNEGEAVFVTRRAPGEDGQGPGDVSVLRAPVDASGASVVEQYQGIYGAYPVAADPGGRLVTVVIDGSGSTVYREGNEVVDLGPHITRDWDLSPGGDELAFIETNLAEGERYIPRTASLSGVPTVRAQSTSEDVEALGVAWDSGSEPVFGYEASVSATGDSRAFAQSREQGFDIPLSYSTDGSAIAVQHWTGSGFDQPGAASVVIINGQGRVTLDDATRFYGWSER